MTKYIHENNMLINIHKDIIIYDIEDMDLEKTFLPEYVYNINIPDISKNNNTSDKKELNIYNTNKIEIEYPLFENSKYRRYNKYIYILNLILTKLEIRNKNIKIIVFYNSCYKNRISKEEYKKERMIEFKDFIETFISFLKNKKLVEKDIKIIADKRKEIIVDNKIIYTSI
ncbi:hypothetical protein SLOPH_925 [Spraguea lophii 42_110]|uniref:Uncharacterized protein n=1 Tax=Spraguea lophii (strain 42_110) TaxID=1358809 RepID=S7WB41_SPRLO|nr:hypothetical protein SLOPH_925 [Spraguea lophii 42_110]